MDQAVKQTDVKVSMPYSEFSKQRKSFQVRALVGKTLAQQRRQIGTNLCCAIMCPVIMVGIVAIGLVLVNVLRANAASGQLDMKAFIRFCSNDSVMSSSGFPQILNNYADLGKADNKDRRFPANYYQFSRTGQNYSCVNWFEDDYPQTAPYEGNTASQTRDTYFSL